MADVTPRAQGFMVARDTLNAKSFKLRKVWSQTVIYWEWGGGEVYSQTKKTVIGINFLDQCVQSCVLSHIYFGLFSMLDASSVITHTLMFTALVRGVRIYPWHWVNWICLRAELYGYYLSSEMCASSGPAEVTSKPCVGDRNCGQNAECTSPRASRIQKQGISGL